MTTPDRTGQTWEEHNIVFTVVGPPVAAVPYDRHPVCFLIKPTHLEEKFVDEGDIPWENFPYMTRLA